MLIRFSTIPVRERTKSFCRVALGAENQFAFFIVEEEHAEDAILLAVDESREQILDEFVDNALWQSCETTLDDAIANVALFPKILLKDGRRIKRFDLLLPMKKIIE